MYVLTKKVVRRRRRSCTQKRVTSANSSAMRATPATQESGETFLSLYKNPCTERDGKPSHLLASPCDACTSLPLTSYSLPLQPILDGKKRERCKSHSTLEHVENIAHKEKPPHNEDKSKTQVTETTLACAWSREIACSGAAWNKSE